MKKRGALRAFALLNAAVIAIVTAGTAHASSADLSPPEELARRPRNPPPPPPAPVNPNADEWALINLTAADVSSASSGSGVKVAVLDGMADCTHPDLSGRCSVTKISGGSYFAADTHGTHTSGTIAGKQFGVAPAATILNYAVFDRRGWVATGTKLSDAWTSAYNAGARISSMSFGCSKMAFCFTSGEITTMGNSAMPMLYVKAAGNDGALLITETTSASSTAAASALNRTLLVGSVNVSGNISSFSNRPGEGCFISSQSGTCSESMKWKYHFLVAPGEMIYATLPGGKYGYMSGTSMATPIVAGVAALLQQRWPTLKSSPENLAQILLTTATDLGDPGVDGVYGYGLLNVAAAFRANGAVAVVSLNGKMSVVTNTQTSTSPRTSKLGKALAGVTVYDRFGRDFSLGETGALNTTPNPLAMRQLLGRRLLGVGGMADWADTFFADDIRPRGFAMYGSPADPGGSSLQLDQSARIGIDMPFNGGAFQFRLMGAGDARVDLSYDATMRPLAQFASTGLLRGALISNALVKLPGQNRLMVYAITTPGTVDVRLPYEPLELRLTAQGLMPRVALKNSHDYLIRQTGVGFGFWSQPNPQTVLGVNFSAVTQKGGYYDMVSDLSDFDRPTRMFNLGAAVLHRIGSGWELSASGEVTHLQTSVGDSAINFAPANLVSAEIGIRKNGVAFASGDLRDSFSFAVSLPPRAVSGGLRVDYLTRTADGLGAQAARMKVPLSELGQEPVRVEAAYRIGAGSRWSFSLSGGLNLAKVEGLGVGEALANFALNF